MQHAYFIARCKDRYTDPGAAREFAATLGLTLWVPADEVTYDFPAGAIACRTAIDQAAAVICQPPIGNDCSWELGYAAGTGKKIFVLGRLDPDDWMTKIDVEYVDAAAPPVPAIHPAGKSLARYIDIGFRRSTGQDLPPEAAAAVRSACAIDTSVLIVDDILDGSAQRAGRPCLYYEQGVGAAIVEAMLLGAESVDALLRAADVLLLPAEHRLLLHEAMNGFVKDMYTGQRLDLQAREDAGYRPAMLDRYRRIVTLITGSHVRLGFDCGQLLAGRRPDEEFGRAGTAIGVVRQILDDFEDYFQEHHEPFGDFMLGLNRLPELLFKRLGGDRAEVLRLLADGRAEDARARVLSKDVRRGIHDFCMNELTAVRGVQAPVDLPHLAGDVYTVLAR